MHKTDMYPHDNVLKISCKKAKKVCRFLQKVPQIPAMSLRSSRNDEVCGKWRGACCTLFFHNQKPNPKKYASIAHMQISIAKTQKDMQMAMELVQEMAAHFGYAGKVQTTARQFHDESDCFTCFLAKNPAGQAFGMAFCCFRYATWTGKMFYVDDLFVREAFRGQGIGTALMRSAAQYAKQNGCRQMKWQVEKDNAKAIALYKNIGASVQEKYLDCEQLLL